MEHATPRRELPPLPRNLSLRPIPQLPMHPIHADAVGNAPPPADPLDALIDAIGEVEIESTPAAVIAFPNGTVAEVGRTGELVRVRHAEPPDVAA